MKRIIMINKHFVIASAPLSKETNHTYINRKTLNRITLLINNNREPWYFKISSDMVKNWQSKQKAKGDSDTQRSFPLLNEVSD
ncbi:hypothetical protein [Lactococcus lactis]